MNSPGLLTDANWTWRVRIGYDKKDLAQKLFKLTQRYGRLGNQIASKSEGTSA